MGNLGIATASLLLLGFAASARSALAQEYDGPAPPEADVPYLLHAHNLVKTEVAEARLDEGKNETTNIVTGSSSPVRTPLAEPIFIIKSDEIDPRKLGLWHVEVVKGNREITFPNNPERRIRRGPFPLHTLVKDLGDDVYWIEANEYLDNGEYCLSPEGSQKVFCFQVY